jgi:DNA-binding GntR family transcriptional regulator
MGHQLHWRETITARMPTPAEAESLRLPLATPILRVLRTTTNQAGVPLEVNDTRMSAEVF